MGQFIFFNPIQIPIINLFNFLLVTIYLNFQHEWRAWALTGFLHMGQVLVRALRGSWHRSQMERWQHGSIRIHFWSNNKQLAQVDRNTRRPTSLSWQIQQSLFSLSLPSLILLLVGVLHSGHQRLPVLLLVLAVSSVGKHRDPEVAEGHLSEADHHSETADDALEDEDVGGAEEPEGGAEDNGPGDVPLPFLLSPSPLHWRTRDVELREKYLLERKKRRWERNLPRSKSGRGANSHREGQSQGISSQCPFHQNTLTFPPSSLFSCTSPSSSLPASSFMISQSLFD